MNAPSSTNNASRPRILVTGANGQLGMELRRLAPGYPAFEFIFAGRDELPVDNDAAVDSFFKKYQPAFCFNCAAYTAVDKAETEKEEAYRINAYAVRNLARHCRENGCRLIHVSTDYVFDGRSSEPYKETDAVEPQSVYGASKLAGEEEAISGDPTAIIIRTSWVYSEYGKNFVKTMLKLMAERTSLNVVNDQVGSPTYAADLAEAMIEIAGAKNAEPGIYHFSNEGRISWYDFAVMIAKLSGSSCTINPIPASAYPTPAKRPAFSLLSKEKIHSKLGIAIKDWEPRLRECLQRLRII